MKLAEALQQRKLLNQKLNDISERLKKSALIQEGDKAPENPTTILAEYESFSKEWQKLVIRINKTNTNNTLIGSKKTIMEAIAERDVLSYAYNFYNTMAQASIPEYNRYSRNEVRYVSLLPVKKLREKADEYAKKYRLLDIKIQEANWTIELE